MKKAKVKRPVNSVCQLGRVEDPCKLVKPLLMWYDNHARILPWRSEPTPYRVWISEIMLQQTQVKTVLPYFERFVAALPDVDSLASADEAVLLKLWEGLGYYSRARNLQKAARVVVEQYKGIVPASYEQLLELPGIGEYTAGAVASIAYNIPVPVVDGNVLRVLSRLLASWEDVAQARVRKGFREVMAGLLPRERAGDFNQAVMELGATVCLPAAPNCSDCPVRHGCAAEQQECADQLPVKAPKAPRRIEQRTVLLLMADGKVLLRQRPTTGLLAGLWELPNFEGWMEKDAVESTIGQWNIQSLHVERMDDGRHIFSHVEWQMRGYLVRCTAAKTPPEDCVWVTVEDLSNRYALPSAFKNFMRYLSLNVQVNK